MMGRISVPNRANKHPIAINRASFDLDMVTPSQKKWAHKKRINKLKEEQPKMELGSEVVRPITKPEVFRTVYGDGIIRYKFPTPKNWSFVKYYLETGNKRTAYIKAGYTPAHTNMEQRIDQVFSTRNVQILLQLIMGDFIERRKISSQKLLNKALEVYDRCDTVKEQLETLKFINSLIPKGVTKCHKGDCPLRKYPKK